MSKDEIIKKLRNLDNKGKNVVAGIKGTKKRKSMGVIVDEASHMVDENKYVIQKIKLTKGGTKFRIAYYTCDANDTRLYYGRSSPIMKASDFSILINKAKKRGWLNE